MGIFDIFKKNEDSQDNVPQEQEIIIESESMVCGLQAFVEKNENAYYFYLWNPFSREDKGKVRSCWICNRRKAPAKVNADDMKNGRAPRMPAEFVAHDINGMELDAEKLSIVWFEEGDSAALLSGGEVICAIPEWSGYKDFHGYSKYAKGTGPFAWEIQGAVKSLTAKVNAGRYIWEYFCTPENMNQWMITQCKAAMAFLENHELDYNIAHKEDKTLGKGTFPPKVVISGTRNGAVYGLTAGVSLVAMPMVSMYTKENPQNMNRMELGFAAVEEHRPLCRLMYANLSMYANIPWQQMTFLGHGHTVPMQNIKNFSAVLFVNPRNVNGLESPEYSVFPGGGAVNMLWVVPITQQEYDFAVKNSSEELLKKAKDISRIHIFDGESKFLY